MSRTLKTTAVAAILVIAVLAAGGTGIGKPAKSVIGDVETEFDGSFSPKALPKERATPLASSLRWKVRSGNEFRPPPVRKFRIKGDRDVALDVRGLPTCELLGLGPRLDNAAVRKKCGQAIVGSGRLEGEVEFAGERTFDFHEELLVVNSGLKGDVATLVLFSYLAAPITAELVAPMKVRKISKGRYGTESIVMVPKIAGDGGSITYFKVNLDKRILRGTCPDGRLHTHLTALLADGTKPSGRIVIPCG